MKVQLPSINVPNERCGNAGIHGSWKCGCLYVFDISFTDTNACTYSHKPPTKVLVDQEKGKKASISNAVMSCTKTS